MSVEAEDALFERRVGAVPEGEGEAEQLPVVADAGEAFLVPAIGARARVLVGEVRPGVGVGAVVLADGAPRALGEVRAPVPPGRAALRDLAQAVALDAHDATLRRGGKLNDLLRHAAVDDVA